MNISPISIRRSPGYFLRFEEFWLIANINVTGAIQMHGGFILQCLQLSLKGLTVCLVKE